MQLLIKLIEYSMEDSLQLPDESEYINVQNLLSPEPLIKDSRQNTPPHSLAYSNSTCVKDKIGDIQLRSPLAFQSNQYSPNRGVIKSNNQNYHINNQKTVPSSPQQIQNDKQKQVVIQKGRYRKINPKSKIVPNKSPPKVTKNQAENQSKKHSESKQSRQAKQAKQAVFVQRKTISKGETKGEIFDLKKRVKQLEQAFHIQTVISEELRTKLSVTTSLLESKLKDNGLQYFLNLKNSSRDLKNIDIFVQMNSLQKALTEKMIIIDRQKNQLKENKLQRQKAKLKKQGQKSPPNRGLNEQIEKLMEEKQSLMSYIEEQKAALKRKIEYIAELQQEINRIGDKASHYTNIERPKIIKQLTEYKSENRKLNEDLETIKMELNLMEISYKEQIQNFHQKHDKLLNKQKQLEKYKFATTQKRYTSTQVQKDDSQKEILLRELKLLKDQRDHYLNQYRKRNADSAKLYALQLKLASQQNRIAV